MPPLLRSKVRLLPAVRNSRSAIQAGRSDFILFVPYSFPTMLGIASGLPPILPMPEQLVFGRLDLVPAGAARRYRPTDTVCQQFFQFGQSDPGEHSHRHSASGSSIGSETILMHWSSADQETGILTVDGVRWAVPPRRRGSTRQSSKFHKRLLPCSG